MKKILVGIYAGSAVILKLGGQGRVTRENIPEILMRVKEDRGEMGFGYGTHVWCMAMINASKERHPVSQTKSPGPLPFVEGYVFHFSLKGLVHVM